MFTKSQVTSLIIFLLVLLYPLDKDTYQQQQPKKETSIKKEKSVFLEVGQLQPGRAVELLTTGCT